MEYFSQQLRRLRLNKGLKQTEMADILGISMQSISAYENGREPDYETLCQLSKFFNVSTDRLLGLVDDDELVNNCDMGTFHGRLRYLRSENELTQKVFSEIIGVAQPTYALYETGKRQPDFDTIVKITDYFNVSLDWLLCRTNIRDIAKEEVEQDDR